ncbi:MAG: tryptophan synthase subunit alpha [Planctomycetota bacterium]
MVSLTQHLRDNNTRGLAPYLTAGEGGLESTLHELQAMESAGASCVELGVPFSDPIADGPHLQAAAQRSLDAGTNLRGILDMVKNFRAAGGDMPLVLMSYANPLMRHGIDQTVQDMATAGIDGLIIPDLPLEEGAPVERACASSNICPIFFAAPTSPEARVEEAGRRSRGFLYVVGRVGVTGVSTSFDEETQSFIQRTRELSAVPIAVGFGIGSAEHVHDAVRHADLAIVGTALVRHLFAVQQERGNRAVAAANMVHALIQGLK